MPEIVCTIEVKAAIGITYRAVSIARFSASRSICFSRSGVVVVLEERREIGVTVPRAHDRGLVDVKRLSGDWRDKRARLLQLDVALARLLRVVKGVRVQERPHELARDVLEAELEVRVLVDRVMAGVERQRANRVALLVRDFDGRDYSRRIARPCGGDGAVKGRTRSVS